MRLDTLNSLTHDTAMPTPLKWVTSLSLAAACFAAIMVLGWFLTFANRGIDFTDEGFYLNWISSPWSYDFSVTQFGFVYHPLDRLFDGNIVLLRQANIVITFALAWLLAAVLILQPVSSERIPRYAAIMIAAVFASASFSFFYYWLVTPSYNSLALQALLLVATGMVLADRRLVAASLAGWILLSIGGVLVFLAKPSSAAVVAIVAAAYLIAVGKLHLHNAIVAVAAVVLLLLVAALLIDGSVYAFYTRIAGGAAAFTELGAGQAERLFRLEKFSLTASARNAFALIACVTFISVLFCCSKNRFFLYAGMFAPIFMAICAAAIITQFWLPEIRPQNFDAKIMLSIPLGALAAVAIVLRERLFSRRVFDRTILAFGLLFFPYAFAFGSGTNLWAKSVAAGVFWVLAAIPFLLLLVERVGSWRPLLPPATLGLFLAFLAAYAASEDPYRQPQPLRQNDQIVAVGKTPLVLEKEFATYIRDLSALARSAGFTEGTPMIDLTGHSPTSLHALQAKPIGQPWFFGGYPGSNVVAIDMLKRVPCEERNSAWLLIEPDGPHRLSTDVLRAIGLDVDSDFEPTGELLSPAYNGFYGQPRIQIILKPAASSQTQKPCDTAQAAE